MQEINETIRKSGNSWTVYSKSGKKMGSYRSKGGAKKRLRQIEYFKHVHESELNDFEGLKWTDKEIVDAAAKCGMNITEYSMEEIKYGLETEMEHGSEGGQATNLTHDLLIPTLQITIAHLKENPHYYTEILLPAEKDVEMQSEIPAFENYVPTFESFMNDTSSRPQPVSNTIGNTGYLANVDGGELIEYPYETANVLSDDEEASMRQYYDKINSMDPPFGNITNYYRNGPQVAMGFSGPVIKHGPLSGSESWWTLVCDLETGEMRLIHDLAGEIYDVADPEQFGEMMATFAKELYGDE